MLKDVCNVLSGIELGCMLLSCQPIKMAQEKSCVLQWETIDQKDHKNAAT